MYSIISWLTNQHMEKRGNPKKISQLFFLLNCDQMNSASNKHVIIDHETKPHLRELTIFNFGADIFSHRMIYLGAMETYVVTKLSRVGNNLRLYIFVCYSI